MRRAISIAEVGDDVFGEDPTVKSKISLILRKIKFKKEMCRYYILIDRT